MTPPSAETTASVASSPGVALLFGLNTTNGPSRTPGSSVAVIRRSSTSPNPRAIVVPGGATTVSSSAPRSV
jgi:hypothetical protein